MNKLLEGFMKTKQEIRQALIAIEHNLPDSNEMKLVAKGISDTLKWVLDISSDMDELISDLKQIQTEKN